MSSELSNALNPNVISTRRTNPPRPNAADPVAQPPSRPVVVSHRSELELAIAEPQQRSLAVPVRPVNPTFRQTAAVQELLRVLSTSKEAAELERKRRDAWEKEQEAKLAQRQAEMERQVLEMRQELSLLKTQASLQTPGQSPAAVSSASLSPTPAVETNAQPFPVHPIHSTFTPHTPLGHTHMDAIQPPPSYGPNALLTPPHDSSPHSTPALHDQGMPGSEAGSTDGPFFSPSHSTSFVTYESRPGLFVARPRPSSSDASPRPDFVEGSSSQTYATPSHSPTIPVTEEEGRGNVIYGVPDAAVKATSDTQESTHSPSLVVLGKRRTPPASSDEDSASSGDEDSLGPTGAVLRRRHNGHDKRCLTIHHAMRAHILRCMQLDDDKQLPDSHVEGEALPMGEPIRFIWEKTSKQSSHNAAMKRRIVVDLQENRALYKHVSEEDFALKSLENIFDQAFTTFRQKFKAQRDVTAAVRHRHREGQKALRTRRLNRKKTKLANRIDARKRLQIFSHPAFDGALQQECMSSEESCDDNDIGGNEGGRPQDRRKVLRIRKLPWRSLRLQRFYAMLDDEDLADKSTKPKRGNGRIERIIGPAKDPSVSPPMGTSRWMVSKNWVRLIQCTCPNLVQVAVALASTPDGFDGNECAVLGNESDDDADLQEIAQLDRQITVSETSSLQHALTPAS